MSRHLNVREQPGPKCITRPSNSISRGVNAHLHTNGVILRSEEDFVQLALQDPRSQAWQLSSISGRSVLHKGILWKSLPATGEEVTLVEPRQQDYKTH